MPAIHTRHRSVRILTIVFLIALAPSCGKRNTEEPAPTRDCNVLVWAQASKPNASVGITGSWNDWNGVSVEMDRRDDGWYLARLTVAPGEHLYLIVEDGIPRIDDFNPLTAFRGNEEVSLLISPDCYKPKIEEGEVQATSDGTTRIHNTFWRSVYGDGLEPKSVRVESSDGAQFVVRSVDTETGKIVVEATGLQRGKRTVTVSASDQAYRVAEPARSVVWTEPAMEKWSDGILYQIVVDRFLGDGGHLLSPSSSGGRAGGTLDGVRGAIENGMFEVLGVTAVWLSPVYVNPVEARIGPWDGRLYEGYHGYWPVESKAVDSRIGGDAALRALVSSAHQRGIRVILDIVPNHVYETNQVYLQHRNDGWFFDGPDMCICGDPACPWATHIETCWFTSYLPDYRWQNPAVMQYGSSESLWWVEEFDLDGVRIDAVPMMPRAATRKIAHTLRNSKNADRFLLGEVYTGGGQSGINQIRYHLGPDGLESAFDFPLMWTLRSTIAYGTGSFKDVADIIEASDKSYEGLGITISRILGNHDTTRFISEANGDAANDPWDNPPVQPDKYEPYARHLMAMTLMMTLPGLPVLYYGDEVGLAGGGDPDCRRVMPAESALNEYQSGLLAKTRKMGKFRKCSNALRRGTLETLRADKDTYAFVRDVGDGQPVVVVMSKASEPKTITFSSGEIPAGTYWDLLSGDEFRMEETGSAAFVTVEPLSSRVLVSAGDLCL
ncbi:MAG: alpha-amylase family glycosyl hydrolase [Polyangiaceae bacterium]|nr:alpha-amylase family glycosyl hydrolase [Polyangiaceae bacterium]